MEYGKNGLKPVLKRAFIVIDLSQNKGTSNT